MESDHCDCVHADADAWVTQSPRRMKENSNNKYDVECSLSFSVFAPYFLFLCNVLALHANIPINIQNHRQERLLFGTFNSGQNKSFTSTSNQWSFVCLFVCFLLFGGRVGGGQTAL